MRRMINLIFWDLLLEARYQIVTIALLITVLYCAAFVYFDISEMEALIIFLIFSDPSLLGFMFIGAMVLFEKGDNTLQALIVTPMKIPQYLLSKIISLTIIALLASLAMVVAAKGLDFNFLYFSLGVVLTSCFFILLGFISVAKTDSLNQYLITMGFVLVPFFLPFLNFAKITDIKLFYIFPTQASLFLLEASFKEISLAKLLYSIVCLVIWIVFSYFYAMKAFKKSLTTK